MADYRSLQRRLAAAVALLLAVALTTTVRAQIGRWEQRAQIDRGTTVQVRTTEPIRSNDPDGRVYEAIVEDDVFDDDGELAIPSGSIAELIVRRNANNELMLDLDSITVNGRRYAVSANSNAVGTSGRDPNLGINRETGQYVGGGAVLGSIIGAIAGGAKGAAIGAGVGAAAGAGVMIATRGKAIDVPSETMLTYRLDRPLTVNVRDNGFTRDGVHYHPCCQ